MSNDVCERGSEKKHYYPVSYHKSGVVKVIYVPIAFFLLERRRKRDFREREKNKQQHQLGTQSVNIKKIFSTF